MRRENSRHKLPLMIATHRFEPIYVFSMALTNIF